MDALGNQNRPGAPSASSDPNSQKGIDEANRRSQFRKEAEIAQLRENARAEAYEAGYKEGFAAARDEGFAQGQAEGLKAGEDEMREKSQIALEPIRHLALGFSTALNGVEAEMGEQIANIALKIGQQLAMDAIKENPQAILNLVGAVLRSDPEMIGKPRLRANPEDIEMIEAQFGKEITALGWQLFPDSLISRGGCKVISNNGEIDATWESRWAAVLHEYQREKPAK
jgi:flagellar assembly protein FliH